MTRQNNFQVNFRTDEENFMWSHNKNNYSQYINELIIRDRLASGDQRLIDARIHEHQQEIDRLKELKQTKRVNSEQLQQVLKQGQIKFDQRNQVEISDSQNRDWIKRIIFPDVKRAGGSDLNEYKLLEMFKAGRLDV